LPNVFILCVPTHEKLPRQIEGKVLPRSPVVGSPLKKKHIRVFMLLEYTSDRPFVSVEIEERLTASGQIKVALMQPSAAQKLWDCSLPIQGRNFRSGVFAIDAMFRSAQPSYGPRRTQRA
jgi:hypothetical protein